MPHGEVAGARPFGLLNPRLLFAPCLLPPAPCPSFIHSLTFMGIHSGETTMVTVQCGGAGRGHESDDDGTERTVAQSFSEAT